ncbi:MAG: signal peptide peptidase SppA [Nitrospirae bacterium]|nr:MAG: signal peptide peptidase SppA [Nitrospirota bacterium]
MKKGCLIITGLMVLLVIISLVLTLFQKNLSLKSKIALVRVEGPIIDSKDVIEEIRDYTRDRSIKAIVLRVDSPGGAVAPSQEIYAEVKKAVARKKVVVSMGSVAASGGYYISAPATKIMANPGTLTGSIGVIMEIPNVEELMKKIGVRSEVVKSGRNKDVGSMFRTMKEEDRELLQGVLDNVHAQFIRAVAEGRKMTPEAVKLLADGRIFTGEQALQNGLIDEIGTLDDAEKAAARLAGLPEDSEVVTKKEKMSLFDLFRGKIPKEFTDLFPAVKIKYQYVP